MIATQTNTGASPEGLLAKAAEDRITTYSAYGLTIQSELPLPEFTPVPSEAAPIDVNVQFGPGLDWIPAVRDQKSSWLVDATDSRFWFQGVGGFRIRNGREITISREPEIDDALLRMYVEGMMMATLLFQRGHFVLHASVVRIGDSAAALLGHVGAGKSSSAAALHARGHAVVTDDNAAITFTPDSQLVTPAFPYVKVFPAIAAALGYDGHSLTRMHPSQPKFVSPVTSDFPTGPVPLTHIYVLTRDAAAPVAPLARAETIIELVRNSVPTRWKLAGGANHLQQCASLAARVPAYRVRTFSSLDELPVLAETIERHHSGAALA